MPLAEVAKYVRFACRRGADWFVGTLNNGEARTLTFPLDFLPRQYEATVFADAPDVAANHLLRQTRVLSRQNQLEISLPPGGGQVMILRRGE